MTLLMALLGGSLGAIVVAVISEQADPTRSAAKEARAKRGVSMIANVPRAPQYASAAVGGNGANGHSED
jgi:hypothetical protein